MFRTVSQTAVTYRGSTLSDGRAGAVNGGDRLPWLQAELNEGGNYAPLSSLDWQIHVYGEASSELQAACDAQQLPLHVFPWRRQTGRAGLRRSAAYLVRPDGYVALADADGGAAAVTAYLAARQIVPAPGTPSAKD